MIFQGSWGKRQDDLQDDMTDELSNGPDLKNMQVKKIVPLIHLYILH